MHYDFKSSKMMCSIYMVGFFLFILLWGIAMDENILNCPPITFVSEEPRCGLESGLSIYKLNAQAISLQQAWKSHKQKTRFVVLILFRTWKFQEKYRALPLASCAQPRKIKANIVFLFCHNCFCVPHCSLSAPWGWFLFLKKKVSKQLALKFHFLVAFQFSACCFRQLKYLKSNCILSACSSLF